MLVIICAKYGKNPSGTVCAVERTQQDVPYFSSFIKKSWLNDLEDISQGQRSLCITHVFYPNDHLCLIWKELIQNCRSYRTDKACEKDWRSEINIPFLPQRLRCAWGMTQWEIWNLKKKAGCAFSAILVKSPIWFQLFHLNCIHLWWAMPFTSTLSYL